MATIIATLNNGNFFEFPEENLQNVRRMLGHQIVSLDYKAEPEDVNYSEVEPEAEQVEEVKTEKRGRKKKVTN